MTKILGITAFQHDSAACLIIDGKIVAAVEEERLTRKKHDGSFPHKAISYCLKEAGITINDLDHVAFFWNPWKYFYRRVWHVLSHLPKSISFLTEQAEYTGAWLPMVFAKGYLTGRPDYDKNKAKFKFHYVHHHKAHAASTFFLSPFEEAAILSIDGVGEWTSTYLAQGSGTTIKKIKSVFFPHSLGSLYTTLTLYLGFKRNSDEYKVMGMSAYGKPTYYDEFKKIIKLSSEKLFRLDLKYFDYVYGKMKYWSQHFENIFGPPRKPETEFDQHYFDIAASLQKVFNETMVHIGNVLFKETGEKKLCMAGGVALNSVANGVILKECPFDDIWFQPAAYDSGASVGAALYVHHVLLGNPRKNVMRNVYLGPGFSDDEIEEELKSCKLTYRKSENIASETAEMLSQGKIIGWFQDRMEFGPRALGARSIIADPRTREMMDIVNMNIKHRESFRPFAPAILEEHSSEYFDSDYPSPYMLLVYNVLPGMEKKIAAVTHVDGTARVQTVDSNSVPAYRSLIEEFYKITGVPVILNTSFNVRGEPIVTNPADAIRCFYSTGIDSLVIGNYIVDK
ncbi:carbamoyltransferase [Candidatus Latescibacterota bacterium]